MLIGSKFEHFPDLLCNIDLKRIRVSCRSIFFSTYVNGTITIRMAFSCTCQPKRYELKPHMTSECRKFLYVGFRNSEYNDGYVDNDETKERKIRKDNIQINEPPPHTLPFGKSLLVSKYTGVGYQAKLQT